MEKGATRVGGGVGVGSLALKKGGMIMAESASRRVTFFVSRFSNGRQVNHDGTTFVGKPRRTPQQ